MAAGSPISKHAASPVRAICKDLSRLLELHPAVIHCNLTIDP